MVNTQIILVSVSFIVMLVLFVLTIKLLYYGKDESKSTDDSNPKDEYYISIPPNLIPNNGFNIKSLYKDEYNSQKLLNIIVKASQNLQTKTEELQQEINGFKFENLKEKYDIKDIIDPSLASAVAEAEKALASATAVNKLALASALSIAKLSLESATAEATAATADSKLFEKYKADRPLNYVFTVLKDIHEKTPEKGKTYNLHMVELMTEFITANNQYSKDIVTVTNMRKLFKEPSKKVLSEFYRYYKKNTTLGGSGKPHTGSGKPHHKIKHSMGDRYKTCVFTKIPVSSGESPVNTMITDNELCGRISGEIEGPKKNVASGKCTDGATMVDGKCFRCPEGQTVNKETKLCVPKKNVASAMSGKCPSGEKMDRKTKQCKKIAAEEFYYYY